MKKTLTLIYDGTESTSLKTDIHGNGIQVLGTMTSFNEALQNLRVSGYRVIHETKSQTYAQAVIEFG